VTSISTMVRNHLDREFMKMSQQLEQKFSQLSKLVCNALNLENAPGTTEA